MKVRSANRNARFTSILNAGLHALGATHLHIPAAPNAGNWTLESSFGPLHVSVYDNWVACRFEDVKRAAKVVNCNRNTGKWNFHFEKFPSMADAEARAEYMVKMLTAAGNQE